MPRHDAAAIFSERTAVFGSRALHAAADYFSSAASRELSEFPLTAQRKIRDKREEAPAESPQPGLALPKGIDMQNKLVCGYSRRC